MAPSARDQQPYVRGLGKLYKTPKKKRRGHAANQVPVQFLGRDLRIQSLRKRLQGLVHADSGASASQSPPVLGESSADIRDADDETSGPLNDVSDALSSTDPPDTFVPATEPIVRSPPRKKRRRQPAAIVVNRLYERWKDLLPSMVPPLLEYLQRSAGRPVATGFEPAHTCTTGTCVERLQDVTLLFWDPSGMFPTAPTQPRLAVSIDLLDLYSALFERSGDAVTALARALRRFYTRRGWRILDSTGAPMTDPFRKPLGRAVQWYDSVLVLIERALEDAVETARLRISPPSPHVSQPDLVTQSSISGPEKEQSRRRMCASLLQRRCPACFGGDTFGRSFAEGADIIVAVDGNFSHRHLRTAGDSPSFHDPDFFISKAEVDAVGAFITTQRKKSPSKTFVPKVPDAAVDSCQHGHEAANEQKAKTNGERFDDTGVMALVCSHDIPIFAANIDTPGEQQKYALALVIHLFSLLPEDATIGALYDIGCTTDRSIGLYSLLPSNVASRIMWAISVMHAYGHEWACQLVYNPRLRPGLGLRDGEGVERLWSRLRVFIPVTRTSGRSRRIWLLDRQLCAITDEMRDNLGVWITRKLRHGVWDQYTAAKAIVLDVNVSVVELRRQWAMQQEAQLSIRAHAPARLKKEVDAVLSLQAEIERVENALEAVRDQFQASGSSTESIAILTKLVRSSDDLGKRAESLYSSLNIANIFPELHGLPPDFVRMLVLARDIKINIRKRVTAQLLEFDRIDRAAGGKDNPLGTRLHQHTRKSIARRQPAILTAIRKFNKYCAAIQEMANTSTIPSSLPIPRQLSTDLAVLREHPDLYEDVWTYSPTPQETPKWLEDADMRKAIRALLKMERCAEEEMRLQNEVKNLCQWFGREMAATELALRTPENLLYLPLLQQRFDSIALLQRLWENPLLKEEQLKSRMAWANITVRDILGPQDTSSVPFDQSQPPVNHVLEPEDDDDDNIADIFSAADDLDPLEIIDAVEDIEFADDGGEEDVAGIRHHASHSPPAVEEEEEVAEACTTSVSVSISPEDYQHIADPNGLLTSDCINSCAALLQREFASSKMRQCAIFSTWDADTAALSNDGGMLARSTRYTFFWERNIWLVPLHQPGSGDEVGHWTLVVVDLANQVMFHFDSFADKMLWRSDIHRVATLVVRACNMTSMPIPSGDWRIRPLLTSSVQSNGSDCGVWILAAIAARLRGFDTTALREKDIPNFRKYLCYLVTRLGESA
ncbi:hypothetical protein OBBRIDRAFT_863019 [Obba rivulosa]|uniref:Ubiquitin-like protease family profile domain-containing protein n=1 Tax=Obba rivulosa TaxID=1052685 RepID=A0A8E2DLZ2_9APHY|nr:hypothetical protein OBBRIDRAFT_863019 [Obba rivulosa]